MEKYYKVKMRFLDEEAKKRAMTISVVSHFDSVIKSHEAIKENAVNFMKENNCVLLEVKAKGISLKEYKKMQKKV